MDNRDRATATRGAPRLEPGVTLEIKVLGHLEVLVDGERVALGGSKERRLLCLLVLHRRDALSVERVAEDLWDGQPPQQCGAAVRVYISHLRKALGDKVIETRPSGYQLHL